MKQQQSIGSSNQGQALPKHQQEEKTPGVKESVTNQTLQPEKPAITDDAGNIVDKKHQDAGKGYSENKPTEPLRNATPAGEKPANVAPEHQHPETENVYGPKTEDNIHHKQGFPEQTRDEEKDSFEKRSRQAGNVAG